MTRRELYLAKDGQAYLFRYSIGDEGEIVDAIMHLADSPGANLDWIDAATLGFQVAQNTAEDYCTVMTAPQSIRKHHHGVNWRNGTDGDSDDAKDGPCTSTNCP